MRPWNASLFVLTCLGAGVGIPIPLDGLGSSTVGRRAVICETTDLEAEPLVDSLVVDEDMLECEYGSNSSFTFCTYGIGNSSLTQGPPSCPPFLALEQNPANPVSRTALDPVSSGDGRNGPSSTFHTSSTVFSSQISSSGGSSGAGRGGQSTPSFTGSAQQTTSAAPEQDLHRTAISTGAKAGIVIAVLVFVLGLAVAFMLCGHRLQKRGTPRLGAVSPYKPLQEPPGKTVLQRPTTPRLGAVSPYPLLQEPGCNTNQEKHMPPEMPDILTNSPRIEDAGVLQPKPQADVGEVAVQEENTRPPQVQLEPTSPRDAVVSAMEAELQASREQINLLLNRMNALEADTELGWGTREPPPEYASQRSG